MLLKKNINEKNEILLYMTITTRANKVMSILHKEIMKLKEKQQSDL